MCERLHRIAIIGMLVTAVLGASLATRDLIHHSNPPHSSITLKSQPLTTHRFPTRISPDLEPSP
jgi:hypothetical protein